MSRRQSRALYPSIFALLFVGGVVVALRGAPQTQPERALAAFATADPKAFLDKNCITCHNQKLHTAGLALDGLDSTKPGANAEVWERVIAKLRAGSMPPPGIP